MTKKPSEKNKAWEKDRRDRLNKSFENLSKLLPNYDPSTVWTKNEIIQKSVLHIEDLHDKYEKCLTAKDPKTLILLKGLTDAIQYFQCRNKQICDNLKDKKINLPALNLPKFLTEYPQYNIENHIDIQNTKDSKCSSTIKKQKEKAFSSVSSKNKIIKPISVSTAEQHPAKDQGAENNVQPNQFKNQQQSSQLNNSVLLPIQQPLTPNLIQIASSISTPLILNRNKNGKIFLLSKPEIKVYFSRSDGKIPIPVIKKYVPLPIKHRNRKNNTNRKMKENQEIKTVSRKRKLSQTCSKVLKCKLKEDCGKLNQTTENAPIEKINSRSLSPTAAFLQSFPVVAQKSIDTDILCDLPSNTINSILVKPKDKSFRNIKHVDQKTESDPKIKTNYYNNLQTTNEMYQNVTPVSNDLTINTAAAMKPFFTSSYTTSCNNSKTKLLNLSTQKPICTPLPLDNKGEDVQNLTKPDPESFKNNSQQNNFRTIFNEQYNKSDANASKTISSSKLTHLNNTFITSSTAQLNAPKSSVMCNKNANELFQNSQYSTNVAVVPAITTNYSEMNSNRGNLLYTPHQSDAPLNTTLMQNTGKIPSLSNQKTIAKHNIGNSNINLKNHADKISESNESAPKVMQKYIQNNCGNLTEKSSDASDCLNYVNNSFNLHPHNNDYNLQLPSHPNSYKIQNEQKPTYISYSEILNTSGQNNLKPNPSKIISSHSSSCIKPSDRKQNEELRNNYPASEKQKIVAKSLETIPKTVQAASCSTTQHLSFSSNQDFTMFSSTANSGYIAASELSTNVKSNKIFEQEKKPDCDLNNKPLASEPKLKLTFNEEFKHGYSNTGSNHNLKKYNGDATTLSNQNSISSCNSNPFMLRPYKYTNNATQSFGSTAIENFNVTSNSCLPMRNFPTFTGSSCNNKISTYENIQTTVASHAAYPITNSASNETESIFSKNYYYPPVAAQPETTFSFNLNTSQQNYFHTSTNLFTFSLTPTTNSFLPSKTPTTNSFLPSKLNEPIQNYTDLINQSCQSAATNFTFSLTTPISSITQSDKLDSFHNNLNENCPKYFDQQFYQNNTTNFTFALTKTTETVSSHNSKTENVENSKINQPKTKVNSQISSQNKNEANYSNNNQFYYDCGQQDYLKVKDQSHEAQKTHENWIPSIDCNKKNENWNYKFTRPSKTPRTDHNFKVPSSIDAFNKNPKTIKPSQNLFSVSQLVHDCENYQSTSNDLNSQENKKNTLIKEKKNIIPVDSFTEQKFYNYSAESLISKKEKHKINTVPNCNVGTEYYPQNSFNYNNIDETYSSSYLLYNQEEYTNNDFTKNSKCLLNKKGQQSNFHQPVGSYDSGNYMPPPPALGSEYYSHNYYSNNNNVSTFNNNWSNHQTNEVNNSSGNLTNFYLSSICPEINEKNNSATNW